MVATHDAMRRDETGRGPVPLVPTFSVGCLDVHIGVPCGVWKLLSNFAVINGLFSSDSVSSLCALSHINYLPMEIVVFY